MRGTLHTDILQLCLNSSRMVVDFSIRKQNEGEDPIKSVPPKPVSQILKQQRGKEAFLIKNISKNTSKPVYVVYYLLWDEWIREGHLKQIHVGVVGKRILREMNSFPFHFLPKHWLTCYSHIPQRNIMRKTAQWDGKLPLWRHSLYNGKKRDRQTHTRQMFLSSASILARRQSGPDFMVIVKSLAIKEKSNM